MERNVAKESLPSVSKPQDEGKTEFRLAKLEELPAELKKINDTLIRIETAFNGGPGSWQSCLQHKQMLETIQKQVEAIKNWAWAWRSTLIVVIVIADVFSPKIQKYLHILGP